MKGSTSLSSIRRLILGCAALAVSLGMASETTNPPPPDTSSALQRPQEQLDQQTKRIDRLYNAIGPQLAELEERAAALEKQQQEDKANCLSPVRATAPLASGRSKAARKSGASGSTASRPMWKA